MVDFKYTTNGLGVTFRNISDDYPSMSWEWSFGDGNKSTEENPTHTYSEVDFYRVTLSVVNESGEIVESISKRIMVSDVVKTYLSDTIYSLINTYIPENIFGVISEELKQQFIGKWQLYIQPLVNHEIPLEEYSNELYYEALENQLIMELAAYDYLVVKANQIISAASTIVVGSDDGSGEGNVKKITTGPTEVEYFEGDYSDLISSIVKAMQPGGMLDVLKQNLCMLSERLDIYLPICRETSTTVIPRVVNRRSARGLDGPNPPTIVKKGL